MASALIGAALELGEYIGVSAGASVEGALLGSGLSEGAAAKAGSTVSGAVKGSIVSGIQQTVESAAENTVDYIFGEGTSKKVEDTISKSKDIAIGLTSTGFDVEEYTKQKLKEQSALRQTQADSVCPVEPSSMGHNKRLEENIIPSKDPYTVGNDLGKFISLTSTTMINDSISKGGKQADQFVDIFKKIKVFNPSLSYLFEGLFDHSTATGFQSSIPEYEEISKIYNGKGIEPKNVKQTINEKGFKNFSIYNEIGELKTWIGNNDYTVIPTIHGYWVGPNSRNDVRPIDLLDTYSMMHDIDYQNNQFGHKESDLKFLSRISQNIQNMGLAERAAAKIALNYFSTIGGLVSFVLGNDEIGKPSTTLDDGSIYRKLIPDIEYQTLEYKDEFKKGISDGLREESISSSAFSLGSRPVNPIIKNKILNLEIQLN